MAKNLAAADHDDACAQLRIAAVRALDALEDGEIDFAAEILRGAGDARSAGPAKCPRCSFRGWPGQLEHHLLAVHRMDWDEVDDLVGRRAA